LAATRTIRMSRRMLVTDTTRRGYCASALGCAACIRYPRDRTVRTSTPSDAMRRRRRSMCTSARCGWGAIRPRSAGQRVAADHGAEPVDQRDGEGGLDRRQAHPTTPVAQQPSPSTSGGLLGVGTGGEPGDPEATSRSSAGSRIQSSRQSADSGVGLAVQKQQPGEPVSRSCRNRASSRASARAPRPCGDGTSVVFATVSSW
jgi:hypothetical protein